MLVVASVKAQDSRGQELPFISVPEVLDTSDLVVHYDYELHRDSTNYNYVDNVSFMLLSSKKLSMFCSEMYWLREELDCKWAKRQHSGESFFINDYIDASKTFPKINAISLFAVLKSFEDDTMSTEVSVANLGVYRFSTALSLMTWQLSTDTATIGRHFCQKATTSFGGRDWVAWYAPAIPISDGSYRFSGLPGLIIRLYDTKKEHVFEVSGILQEKKAIYRNTDNDMRYTTSREAMFKAFKVQSCSSTVHPNNPDDISAKIARYFSSLNNFIEKPDK